MSEPQISKLTITACTGSGLAENWVASVSSSDTVTFSPQECHVEGNSIQSNDSGRMSEGSMFIKFLKSNLRKIEVNLPPYSLTSTDEKDVALRKVLGLVQGKVVEVTYPDPYTNATRKRKAYCSGSGADWYSGVIYGGIVEGAKFNLIEMDGEH